MPSSVTPEFLFRSRETGSKTKIQWSVKQRFRQQIAFRNSRFEPVSPDGLLLLSSPAGKALARVYDVFEFKLNFGKVVPLVPPFPVQLVPLVAPLPVQLVPS